MHAHADSRPGLGADRRSPPNPPPAGPVAGADDRLAAFHRMFAPHFGRREVRERSLQYLRGLLADDARRRSAERVATLVAGASPRAVQRLLTASPWSAAAVLAALQPVLAERLAHPEGVYVV